MSDAAHAFYEAVQRDVQAKRTVDNFLELGQLAFRTCVHSFMHHELTTKEEKCVSAVAHKYVAISLRATARFGELQAAQAAKDRERIEGKISASRSS